MGARASWARATSMRMLSPRRGAGVEVAEDGVGVGDGGPGAAAAIAGGAGIDAGTFGADGEAAGAEADNGAAACADGLDGEHGLAEGAVAGHAGVGHLGGAVDDEADVGGGAAHVEGEDAGAGQGSGDLDSGGDACGGAGHGHEEGAALGGGDRDHAAGGVEDLEAGAQGEAALQLGEVFGGDGHGGGVVGGGGGAFVFAGFGVHLVGERDVGDDAVQAFGDALFVGRVGVGVEEADGDAGDGLLAQPGDEAIEFGVGERFEDGAVVVEAFMEAEAAGGGYEGRGFRGDVEAIEVPAAEAADLEQVLEAGGGDEGDGGEAFLDDGVGDAGGSVDEAAEVCRRQVDGGDGLEHGVDGVIGSGGDLGGAGLAGGGVDGDDVGEGAADVGADVPAGHAVTVSAGWAWGSK